MASLQNQETAIKTKEGKTSKTIKLVSWNIQYLQRHRQHRQLAFLKDMDVIALQETHAQNLEDIRRLDFANSMVIHPARKNGVMTATKYAHQHVNQDNQSLLISNIKTFEGSFIPSMTDDYES